MKAHALILWFELHDALVIDLDTGLLHSTLDIRDGNKADIFPVCWDCVQPYKRNDVSADSAFATFVLLEASGYNIGDRVGEVFAKYGDFNVAKDFASGSGMLPAGRVIERMLRFWKP
jgi:hypothetical protein